MKSWENCITIERRRDDNMKMSSKLHKVRRISPELNWLTANQINLIVVVIGLFEFLFVNIIFYAVFSSLLCVCVWHYFDLSFSVKKSSTLFVEYFLIYHSVYVLLRRSFTLWLPSVAQIATVNACARQSTYFFSQHMQSLEVFASLI